MAIGNVDLARPMSPWILSFQRHLQQFQSQLRLNIERKSKILMTESKKLMTALMKRKISLMRFLKRNINIDLVTTKLRATMMHQSKP